MKFAPRCGLGKSPLANRLTLHAVTHLEIVEAGRQLTRRYVANGPYCWVMGISLQCGRNLAKPLHVE
jgi:hypothetical protein